MRIGIFDPYLDTMGGGEKYMLTAASCLSKKHEVFVFWDDKKTLELAAKRFSLDIKNIFLTKNIFSTKVSMWNRIFESMKYDRIFYLSDGSIPIIFPKKLFLHFQFPVQWIKARGLQNKLRMKHVSGIICNSDFTKQYIDKTFDLQSYVIYPPSSGELPLQGKLQKTDTILTVGRFSRLPDGSTFKKQEFMINTFKKLIDKGFKKWKFIVVISYRPQDKEGVENLKKSVGSYPIKIEENIENQKLTSLYKSAKIYWHAAGFNEDLKIHPERAEHFGIATVQAMEQGAIPVVMNAGGQKEIVEDNMNGFLWNSQEELLQKTTELIKNTNLQKNISEEAKKRSKYFSKEEFCIKLQYIFQ